MNKETVRQAGNLANYGEYQASTSMLLPIVLAVANRYSRTAKRNNIDFDDIIAEGNLALVEAVQTWKPGGLNIKNWCYRRVSGDIYRYIGGELAYRSRAVPLEDEMLLDGDCESLEGTQYERDVASLLDKFQAELSNNDYQILKALLVDDLSLADIAYESNTSRAYISQLYSNILELLREA